jgi:hypothetical protein
MIQMLKATDIDVEIEWDDEVVEMTAVVVMGKRFEV